MDDQNLEEQQKEQEAGKNTAHTLGKGAATYFGGAAGNQLYNAASNTEVGRRIEEAAGNVIQKNPVLNKASQALNDSGALDAANKGMDAASGGQAGGTNLPNDGQSTGGMSPTNGLPTSDNNKKENQDNNKDDNSSSDSNSENNLDASALLGIKMNKKKMAIAIISAIAPFLLIIIIVIVIFAVMFGPLITVQKYLSGVWNSLVDFFTTDQQELEEKYYKKLQQVQDDIHDDGLCIDVNLITATLTVNRTFDEVLNDSMCTLNCDTNNDGTCDMNCDTDNDGVCDKNCDNTASNQPYDKMTKQVELLANMQIITKKYSLDKKLENETGLYCMENESIELVTPENIDSFDKSLFETPVDSSTYEKIAQNDIGDFAAFFTKKANEELNAAYYIYRPPFDTDGTCDELYARSMILDDVKEISIGTYETRKESVYYWNLINSFIPNYYDQYLPKDVTERQKKIIQIADDIYLLYDQIGPSQTCAMPYTGPSILCPNGVTVSSGDETATYELEEYVAGVVSRESYTSEGMEALKAQAVAARTYVLNYTDYCKKSIPNGTNAQTFTRDINDNARKAAIDTAGEILIYNGAIFSAQYDSFCYQDVDCPDARKNSDGTYSVTYIKLPLGEKHTVTLSTPKYYDWMVYPDSGHARGMSQLVSYQLANQGKSYKEILSYFYSEGVIIDKQLTPTTTEGASIINKSIKEHLEESGSSIESMNDYIYSNVVSAGVSTRDGVVAAATSLVSGIYSQTGYILPYELFPSGKYSGYGIDPEWGTRTEHPTYKLHGLDCSGFISWAIHNGGYAYTLKNAKGWGNSGTKRAWSKGTTDSSAQPGDLIFNEPSPQNGTSGHIRMIIGVNNDGYVVAEASSNKNGVRIVNISFTSAGNYYLVDMSNYYATATKVTDYPK